MKVFAIRWDVDDRETFNSLPKEIDIPRKYIKKDENGLILVKPISEYVEQYGCCSHLGFGINYTTDIRRGRLRI